MGKVFEGIGPELAGWIARQRLFFVATAPLAGDGLLNCSPKGMDTFRILGEREVGYLDLTGSGIETVAHLRENGRIVFMFCALEGAPRIVRLHGTGATILPGAPRFAELRPSFPALPGARAIVVAQLARIGDSCGYGVPRFEPAAERDTLVRWAGAKTQRQLADYRARKNARSLDGLPGLDP